MATYEYTCPTCAHEFDVWCKPSEREHQECFKCGSTAKQVIRTAPALDWDTLAMGEGASPEAVRHFEKKRRQRRAQEEKSLREHGDYGPAAGA